MSVKPWVSDVPALQVPEDLLKHSIERALVDLAKRRAEEELLYHTSKILRLNFLKHYNIRKKIK